MHTCSCNWRSHILLLLIDTAVWIKEDNDLPLPYLQLVTNQQDTTMNYMKYLMSQTLLIISELKD